MRPMKAKSFYILALTGLSLTLGLAQPNPSQPPRQLQLPPGVKALKDLEYGFFGNLLVIFHWLV